MWLKKPWVWLFQGAELTGMRPSDVAERRRLVSLVQLQADEIDSLKDEILALSHKGGHVMPPSQPPPFRLDSRGSTGASASLQPRYFSP